MRLHGDFRVGNVLDVRASGHERRDDTLAHVVAEDVKTSLRELHGQRQADVSETDHADGSCPILDALQYVVFHRELHAVIGHRRIGRRSRLHPAARA